MNLTATTPGPSTTTRTARRAKALVVPLVAIAVLGACTSDDAGDDTTSPTNRRTAQTAPSDAEAARLTLSAAPSPAGAVMTIGIDAPEGSTEMQVGTDPSFRTVEWEPVGDEVQRQVDGGYQEVFARFRDGESAVPQVIVAGLDVDLAAQAATSDSPTPNLIGLSDPRTLTVDIEVGRIVRGTDGADDRMSGADVDPERLDSGWQLTGAGAPRITATERSTVPTDTGKTGDKGDATLFPLRHRVDLALSGPLPLGSRFELTSPVGGTTEFTIDDRSSRSPAVHANQVGYRPADVAKRAFLSAPEDSSAFDGAPAFHVVDVETETSVFDGTAVAEALGPDGEAGKGDQTGLQVWSLDFSPLQDPGRYRVCADAVGCSEPFSLDEDTTWMRVATTVARGLYHQRSGISLGEPTTSVSRPRPDHTDDGLVVHQSSLTALEAADLGDDEIFQQLVAGAGAETVDGAWGGHFDAGDWDRRTQHLWMVREVLDLVRVAPDRFADLDLNLPESGDDVPDIVDEALWTLDLFRRMQRDDGAVRGGVESARFPDFGIPSWEDDLARYAYAPDPWTSYIYASVAADAAVYLRGIDDERAEDYADSATAAVAWADTQPGPARYADKIASQRAVAAASMLRLTGDAAWNTVFIQNTPFANGPTYAIGCNANELCDSGWNYLWVDPQLTDPAIVANIRQSFVDAADRSADASDTTLFDWCLEDPDVPLVWGLGTGGAPRSIALLRGWILTGEQRYLAAAQRCASVSLGGNPLNTSYITGIGANPVRHPLIVDVNVGGLPAWPGTPVYGNHPLGVDASWVVEYRLKPAGATGDDLYAVPYLQSWYDLPDVGPMNEFTVYQSHGPALWVFGVLASATPTSPLG